MSKIDRVPAIQLENVGYYFHKRKGYFSTEKYWALKNVNFTLYKGESLGILGRNGAGKSTLLQLLAGVTTPDRGHLTNLGYAVSLLSLQAGFIPYLTGRENVMLNGLILGISKRRILKNMTGIHEFSGLDSFFDQPINTYSSGMKARLGFSIAFQINPDIYLIDEVLGVGDANFKKKSTKKMKEKINSKQTVVLVSHSASTILDLCDRAVWIEEGTSLAEGDPQDVLDEYISYVKKMRS